MKTVRSATNPRNGNKNPAFSVKIRNKRRVLMLMWTLYFAYLSVTQEFQPVSSASVPTSHQAQGKYNYENEILEDRQPRLSGLNSLNWRLVRGDKGRLLRATANDSTAAANSSLVEDIEDVGFMAWGNCTPPAILDFPPDLFTQEQRRNGAVVVHFIVSLYIFYAVALVCDDYFVPSIENICGELHLPSDVAGATFMAIATSAPELFTNVVGTFITQGDIGVGAIVGSAVFNILAVCACCGFAAKTALRLDWYPLTRDCLFYSLSVVLLILVLGNRQVFWYEALVLVLAYAIYIIVMWKNASLRKSTERFVYRMGRKFGGASSYSTKSASTSSEKSPLLGDDNHIRETKFGTDDDDDLFSPPHATRGIYGTEEDDETLIAKALEKNAENAEDEESNYGVFTFPRGEGLVVWIEWLFSWPARFVFTITIPDCRTSKFRKFYPLTFVMCIIYIALLSYVVSWVMTVIGHTFRIPDSVMGLTFIAAGTSVPEAVSSIIVTRQGLGSMGISNSIGSNTFDILICLGLPWLIRGSMIATAEENFIQINSGGLEYSAIILIVSLLVLYALLACNRFYLDRKVATLSLIMYGLFLVFASMFELNVFFPVNLPTCDIPNE